MREGIIPSKPLISAVSRRDSDERKKNRKKGKRAGSKRPVGRSRADECVFNPAEENLESQLAFLQPR